MKRSLGPILSTFLMGLSGVCLAQTGTGDRYYDDGPVVRQARHARTGNESSILLPIPTDGDAAVAEVVEAPSLEGGAAAAVPAPPSLPLAVPAPPSLPLAVPMFEGPACANGECEPYYRDRPIGCKKKKRATMLNNRSNEPNWYRYYRCNHFGYYPTNWSAWPDGWLACRTEPKPGPHPYDLRHPQPKGLPKAKPPAAGGRSPSPPPPRGEVEPKAHPPAKLDLPPPKSLTPKSSTEKRLP